MVIATSNLTDADRAEARGTAYSLLAHAFRYPDGQWLKLLADEQRWRAWPNRLPESYSEPVARIAALQASIGAVTGAADLDALQARFASLFGHTVRGACPPYELEFGQGEIVQRASELADIGGFYAAFGMNLFGEVHERVDHVSVEAEFLTVLCAKEAWGIRGHDAALVEAVQEAQRTFLRAHFGRWFPAFCRRIQDCASGEFYERLSVFANAFVGCECERLGVTQGSPYLQLRPVDPTEESSQACGVPGECNASPGDRLTQLNVAIGGEGK